jgi:broad specificity phosphatase PhoE
MYLQRHGESLSNVEKVFACRKLDKKLTELGRFQIQNRIPYFRDAGVQRIVASPARRAQESGDILAKGLELNFEIDSDLLEVDIGILEGKSELIPENLSKFFETTENILKGKEDGFEGGENSIQLKERIDRILEKYFHIDGIVLVGHATFFALLLGRQTKYNHIRDLFLSRGEAAVYKNGFNTEQVAGGDHTR